MNHRAFRTDLADGMFVTSERDLPPGLLTGTAPRDVTQDDGGPKVVRNLSPVTDTAPLPARP